jgi:hypothetical protein
VLEVWSLYGQQYDGVHFCATKEHPVTVSRSVLCEWLIAVDFAAWWTSMHLLL